MRRPPAADPGVSKRTGTGIITGGGDAPDRLRDFVGIPRPSACPVLAFFPRAIAAALAPTASELGLQQVSAAPLMVGEPGDVALDGDADGAGRGEHRDE